jgi:ABC-2 type transport system permease protein
MLNPTVMWLTWRQLFARRRWLMAIAFAVLPTLIVLLFRLNMGGGDDGIADRFDFYREMGREILVGTLLPLAALVFGTTAFGGEVDDGTLVYLLVKPIARWQVLLSKYVVAVTSTLAVMAPAILLPWLLVRAPELPAATPWAFLAGAAAGAVLYSALFVMIGITTRRSLVIGLFYIIALESVLSRSLEGIKSLSVREFVVTIAQHVGGSDLLLDATVSLGTVWTVGGVLLAATLGFAMVKLGRMEVAERV